MSQIDIYYYNKNKIIKRIKNYIVNYEEEIKTLQTIKRLYKKDGTDFKNLKQNFNDVLHISVFFDIPELYAYGTQYDYDLKYDETKKRNYAKIYIYDENIKTASDLTPQNIENAIKNTIEKLNKHIEKAENAIKEIQEDAAGIFKDLENVKAKYQKLSKNENRDIYYGLYTFLGYGG